MRLFGLLLPLLLLSWVGCAKKFKFSDGEPATTTARDLLVYPREENLILRRGDVEHPIPFKKLGCAESDDFFITGIFYVFPDGNRALLYSSHGRMAGDLFGHAGRSVGTSCLFDLVNETGTPLSQAVPPESHLQEARRGILRVHAGASTRKLYAWYETDAHYPLEVIDLVSRTRAVQPLPLSRAKCTLVETPADLLVACAPDPAQGDYGEALLVRYGFDTEPLAERSRTTMTLETDSWGTSVALSPDGKYLLYEGSEATPGSNIASSTELLGIREISTGRQVLLLRTPDLGSFAVWEFAPDGQGVLIADEYKTDPYDREPRARVRLYNLNGSLVQTWDLPERSSQLIAPRGGQGFWVVRYGEGRWVPWK
jgi:hypothetical protein